MAKSFEKIVLVGISDKSISDAAETAVREAAESGMVSWFEVKEIRGRLTQDNKIEYQVTVEIGRKLK